MHGGGGIKIDDEDEEEPRPFFFFFLNDDFRTAFAFALSMRPCFANRRTTPSSAFLSSVLFVGLESFSASFSMKLAVSFVIRGVVEFPIDVRRPSDLEAPFFPLVSDLGLGHCLSIRAQEDFFTRVGSRLGGADSAIPPPLIPDVCLVELFSYRRSGFSRGPLLHTHRCEMRTISRCVNTTTSITSTRVQRE